MKIDNKILKKMGIAIGAFIVLIIIIAIIAYTKKNKSYTKEELDNVLIKLTKNYYSNNKKSLPIEGESKTISAQHFITTGEIKNLVLKTGETCSGEINVTNNNGYYLYIPFITCDNIIPIKLSEKIIVNENVVTSGNGLYKINDSYVFRGETVNNHISFAGKNWLILRINPDGTLRILDLTKSQTSTWDDRYNSTKNANSGINDFITNNINSRIKDKLEEIYNNEKTFTEEDKAFLVNYDLCIGKRKETDTINDGSIECSNKIENQPLGLIQVNEYFLASLESNCNKVEDISCTNYNYLANLPSSTWTITASADNTYQVYKLYEEVYSSTASNSSGIMLVAHLHNNILYSSGDGTLTNPYVVN